MVREICGDLICSTAEIIVHQVNCKGVMGAGVAKQIRKKLINEKQYLCYQKICKENSAKELLGRNLYMQINDNQIVANLFGENIPTGRGVDTNYVALERCFVALRNYAEEKEIGTIAIPGYIGCGLAGGDWNYVFSEIILKVFGKANCKLTVVYLQETVRLLIKEFENIPKNQGQISKDWHGFSMGTSVSRIEEYLYNLSQV